MPLQSAVANQFGIIAHAAQIGHIAPQSAHQCDEHEVVRVANLCRPRRGVDADQFIARRKHAHAWGGENVDGCRADTSRDRKLRRFELRPPRQNHRPGCAIRAAPRDEPLGAVAAHDADAIPFCCGFFDRNHAVRAVGHRRAGHDRDRFPRSDRTRRALSGGYFSDDFQVDRSRAHIRASHRVPVHQALVERRIIAVRTDIRSEPESLCALEPHSRDARSHRSSVDDFNRLRNAQKLRQARLIHAGNSSTCVDEISICNHSSALTALVIPSGSRPWNPICCHSPPQPSLCVPMWLYLPLNPALSSSDRSGNPGRS